MFFRSMSEPEQRHIVSAFAFELGKVETEAVRKRMLGHLERIAEIKASDPKRKEIQEIYETWWGCHGNEEIKATELSDEVKVLLDPKAPFVETDTLSEHGDVLRVKKLNANRQRITGWLQRHKGTRVAGYWLEEIKNKDYSRSKTTYRLPAQYRARQPAEGRRGQVEEQVHVRGLHCGVDRGMDLFKLLR
jgi:Catalase-related immune-responsive